MSFSKMQTEEGGRAIPSLVKKGDVFHLLVDGAPFPILGGVLSPSSFSSAVFMGRIWNTLKKTGANTIFGAISWATTEPMEGQFDYSNLDAVLGQARENGLRIVLQWYGSLKGGARDNLTDYAPSWVKLDTLRFPKMRLREDLCDDEGEVIGTTVRTTECASIFGSQLADAEQKAFGDFVKHLRTVDGDYGTVIMVQIGSQIGLTKDFRDCSTAADEAFNSVVPQDLVAFYEGLGSAVDYGNLYSWGQFAGDIQRAGEIFTAYSFAKHVNDLAALAKREYPIPIFTTVSLRETQGASHGSPQEQNFHLWESFAPCLDFVAPKIMHAVYDKTCVAWGAGFKQPLLVLAHPQTPDEIQSIWSAFGTHSAIGVATMNLDRVDLAASPIPAHYNLFRAFAPIWLAARAEGKSTIGFSFPAVATGRASGSTHMVCGGLAFTVEKYQEGSRRGGGCGMLIHIGENKVLAVGYGFLVKAKSLSPKAVFTRILHFHKKEIVDGETGSLQTLRMFNAEETDGGRTARMPPTTPMIAEVQFYCLEE